MIEVRGSRTRRGLQSYLTKELRKYRNEFTMDSVYGRNWSDVIYFFPSLKVT